MGDVSAAAPGHPNSNRRDIFEKCWNFNRARALQEAGLYLYFEVFGTRHGCGASEIMLGDRKILMFGSNDYLDLAGVCPARATLCSRIKKPVTKERDRAYGRRPGTPRPQARGS